MDPTAYINLVQHFGQRPESIVNGPDAVTESATPWTIARKRWTMMLNIIVR